MRDDRRVPPGGGIVIALTATLAAVLAAAALVLWVRHKPKPDFVQTPNYSTFPSAAFDVPADSTPAETPWWVLSPEDVEFTGMTHRFRLSSGIMEVQQLPDGRIGKTNFIPDSLEVRGEPR